MGVGLRGTAKLALFGLGVAAIGGCGGDQNLSRHQAIAKVNALCRDSTERGSQIASGLDTGSDESFLDTLRAQVREKDHLQAQLDELSLGGPSQQVADYAAAQAQAARAARAALKAIKTDHSVESPAVREGLQKLSSAGDASVEAAEKAGLDYCGPLQREIAGELDLGTKPRASGNGYSIIPGSALVGTWEGVATQIGPGEHQTLTYPVQMRIDPRVRIDKSAEGDDSIINGAVRYESFDCGGRVMIFEAGKGKVGITKPGAPFHSPPLDVGYRYLLNERILAGRDSCSAGTITAVTEGDELDWRWRQGDVEATAILRLRGAPKREAVSKDLIRQAQGGEYSGEVTQWGPQGQRSTYPLYFTLYPPGRRPPGAVRADGHTQSYDGPCMGTGELTLESVAGDRAVFRRRFDRYSHCIGGGVIETRRVGDKLLFRWLRQGDDELGERDDVIALGTLSRSGPARGPAPG